MIRGINDDGGRPNYGGLLDRVRGGVDVRDILAVLSRLDGGCRWRLWLIMIRGINDDGGRPNYGGLLDRVRGGVDVRDILAVLSRLDGRSPVLNVLEYIALLCFKLVGLLLTSSVSL